MKTKRVVKVGLAFLMWLTISVAYGSAQGFTSGDILVALTNGSVQIRGADGTLKATLTGPIQGQAKGLAIDSGGNLLVSHWLTQDSTGGNAVGSFKPDGSFAGVFGTGYNHNCNPSGIIVDKTGNVYVGEADCSGDIAKFDAGGHFLQTFNVQLENIGARWIDLAADGCTMYYTDIGRNILRFNVCTGIQQPVFNAAALPSAQALGLRILPLGGVIVADTFDVRRLDAAGNLAAIYDAVAEDAFVSVFLDQDGKSFWTASFITGNVYKFDIATGQIVMSFNIGVPNVGAKSVIIVPPGTVPPAPQPPPPGNGVPGFGRMTGGGNFRASNGVIVHHGFELRCNANDHRQNLEINWGNGQKFHLTSVTTVTCFDDPAIDPEHPRAPIDTLVLTGTGRFNRNGGATVSLVFTDAGEPGINDGVQMVIKDAQGNVVLDVPRTTLIGGNHQAHKSNNGHDDDDDRDDDKHHKDDKDNKGHNGHGDDDDD